MQSDCRDLLPEYLRFLYGLVDSADLPLNVSRETLQDHQVIPKLKRVSPRKCSIIWRALRKRSRTITASSTTSSARSCGPGDRIDFENREKVASCCGFTARTATTATPWSRSDDYLKRAAEGQTQIYYLTGLNQRRSPTIRGSARSAGGTWKCCCWSIR